MDHPYLVISQVREVLTTAASFSALKVPICFIMAGIAIFFGVENQSAIMALTVLVSFDLLMGVIAAYHAKEEITSRRMLKSGSKYATYLVLCSAAFLTESIIPGVTLIDQAMVSYLAVTELISIMENASKLGFSVPTALLNRLKNYSKEGVPGSTPGGIASQ
jgi:toxin secretion/phage lysis holin